jgi:hypothetical protein
MELEILDQILMELLYKPFLSLVPPAKVGRTPHAFTQYPVTESLQFQLLSQR